MGNKRKSYFLPFLTLVLLLAVSVVGCVSKPPVITEFQASPAQIMAGESAFLTWNVDDSTTITIDQGDKILGIVDVDLYSPEFDFVFGEAEIGSGVATVSLYRLRPEHYGLRPNAKVFEERAVTEAVHELGHLYHLGHCLNPKCVMHFSTSLVNIDIKGKTFCSKCQQELKENIAGDLSLRPPSS